MFHCCDNMPGYISGTVNSMYDNVPILRYRSQPTSRVRVSTRPRLELDPRASRKGLLTRELLAFIHPPYILLTALLLAMHVPYM